ncbi:MAG: acetyltransferase, partial [Rhizobacter sp.]|nr:acetyltransferase [Rhizobacter sp.]
MDETTRPSPNEALRQLLIFPCNGTGLEAAGALPDTFHCIGFVDDDERKQNREVYGFAVFTRDALARWPQALVLAVPGSPLSFRTRRAAIEGLGLPPERFATVIDPTARVSAFARVGRNVLVMAGVVVCANAVIGDNVCVLPNSVIHHDSVIGDWSLVGSNVTIAGGVTVGENCYIGSGCSVMNGLRIGDGALLGLASCVIRDVAAGT